LKKFEKRKEMSSNFCLLVLLDVEADDQRRTASKKRKTEKVVLNSWILNESF
jgi:hypothetical protein